MSGGEEERQIVFDQDEYGGKLREYLWTHGANSVHCAKSKLEDLGNRGRKGSWSELCYAPPLF